MGAAGHRDELLSLLTQSSWVVESPFAAEPQTRLFFLRWDMVSPSEPDPPCRDKEQQLIG